MHQFQIHDSVVVIPKDSDTFHDFIGTIVKIHDTHATVRDQDDDCFDVDFDQLSFYH